MIEQRSLGLEGHAGPCSINRENIREIYEMADMRVRNSRGEMVRAISGTRVVGLKSRTTLSDNSDEMGMDYLTLEENVLITDPTFHLTPPSVLIGEQIVKDTDLVIATEIMHPKEQIPHCVGRIPPGKLLLWNPAVMQLGWFVREMSRFAETNGWNIGIKNGKTLGGILSDANKPDHQTLTDLERSWVGLASFAKNMHGRLTLIHRGVEVPDKGLYRSALVHEVARRAKRKIPGVKLFLDPSHSCGPKLRDQIVQVTIDAMHMKEGNSFLYDGILIEAGTSETDTRQHITLSELHCLIEELARFRNLRSPVPSTSKTVFSFSNI